MNETDFPAAFKRCGGDVELLIVTAQMIAEDAPLELQKLDQALLNQDCSAVRLASHALKGMLATFEDSTAVSGLEQIETAAIDGDLLRSQAILSDIREDIKALIARIVAAC